MMGNDNRMKYSIQPHFNFVTLGTKTQNWIQPMINNLFVNDILKLTGKPQIFATLQPISPLLQPKRINILKYIRDSLSISEKNQATVVAMEVYCPDLPSRETAARKVVGRYLQHLWIHCSIHTKANFPRSAPNQELCMAGVEGLTIPAQYMTTLTGILCSGTPH